MMPQRQIYTAAYRCGKTRHLADRAQSFLTQGTSPAATLGLTVHRAAAQALRDALKAASGVELPVATVRRRAIAILEAEPEAAGLPPGWSEGDLLSGIDRRVLLRRAWMTAGAGDGSLYVARAENPGALDWVVALFDQWSAWAGTGDPHQLPAILPSDPALAELWRAYAIYLALCREHGVVAFNEVFGRAVDALSQPAVRRRYVPQLLLLDDVELLTPPELRFVEQLIGPRTAIMAAAAAPLDPAGPLAAERFTAAWLARQGIAAAPAEPVAAAEPAIDVAQYASVDDETHAIAAQIANAAAGRWQDVAIVAFDPELAPLLRRVLPRYGVPVELEDARDGYTLALAPLARAGLQMIAGQALSAAETIALLRRPELGLLPADAHTAITAAEQAHFLPFDTGAALRCPAELSADGRRALEQLRTAAAAVRAERPSRALLRWLDATGLAERAWQRTAAALEPWALTIDREAWERLLTFLRQSETLRANLGEPLTAAAAVDVWTSALALIQARGRPHEHAVAIWTPSELGGCTAEQVWVAGLHEGVLPRTHPPLALADDAALAAAFSALPGFVPPQSGDRAAAWTRGANLLRRAIGRAADAAHLSYSASGLDGRRRLPSLLLAELLAISTDRHGALLLAADVPLGATARLRLPRHPAAPMIEPLNGRLPTLPAAPPVPFVVTPSAIEDYFNCPRRCFYARELRLYDVASSPRQALGHVVHNALHELLRDSAALPTTESRARQLIAEHWIADEARWGSQLKQAVFRQLAETAAVQLARFEREGRAAGRAWVAGECDIRWQLTDEIVVKGRVDRIDRTPEGLEIIDYKLGRHNKSIRELLGEFIRPRDAADWRPADIQLPVYALAVERGEVDGLERLPDERVCRVAQVYPLDLYTDTGKLSSKGVRAIEIVDHTSACSGCEQPQTTKVGTVCRDQLAAVEAEVIAAVDSMRAGDWRPDPRDGSKTCSGCNFRPICPQPQ